MRQRTEGIAVINYERFYANLILQESVDRIIDVFGTRKNSSPFLFFNKGLNLLDPFSTCFNYFIILC